MECFIGWPNRIDEATLAGGSWTTALPLANLKTRQVTQPARSTDCLTASTKFTIDLTQMRSLRAVGLVNHNLSATASWRVKLGATSGGAEIYDSGVLPVWTMTFGDGLEWGDSGWWEGTTDDDYIGAPFAAIHTLTDGFLSARYATIEITDTTNPAGYVQVGRVFIGGGIVPTYMPGYGQYSEQWEDLSTITATDSGTLYYDKKRSKRLARFTLGRITLTEFKTFFEMQRRQGTTGEIMWIPSLTCTEMQQRVGMLGRMRTLSAIEYPFFNLRSQAFEIEEIL